jgi:uncharacterized membrane protein (UPF0127 family)
MGIFQRTNPKGAAQQRQTEPSLEALVAVRNLTRDSQVGSRVEVAGSNVKRSKGLLGRNGLGPGEGMWIIPCEAIHTFFMRFPIDLIYLDKKLRVKKVRSSVKAWRVSACLRAHSVLELPAGTIRETQTQPGDVFELRDFATSGPVVK